MRGTRGAATLLKSNVSVYGEAVKLRFKAKGGKLIEKEIHAPKLAGAVNVLQQLRGRRLFQYRDADGAVHAANAREVNQFLRELAEVEISLKDFRTLLASVSVLDALARAEPATGKRARRRQILDAHDPVVREDVLPDDQVGHAGMGVQHARREYGSCGGDRRHARGNTDLRIHPKEEWSHVVLLCQLCN